MIILHRFAIFYEDLKYVMDYGYEQNLMLNGDYGFYNNIKDDTGHEYGKILWFKDVGHIVYLKLVIDRVPNTDWQIIPKHTDGYLPEHDAIA